MLRCYKSPTAIIPPTISSSSGGVFQSPHIQITSHYSGFGIHLSNNYVTHWWYAVTTELTYQLFHILSYAVPAIDPWFLVVLQYGSVAVRVADKHNLISTYRQWWRQEYVYITFDQIRKCGLHGHLRLGHLLFKRNRNLFT